MAVLTQLKDIETDSEGLLTRLRNCRGVFFLFCDFFNLTMVTRAFTLSVNLDDFAVDHKGNVYHV